MLQESCLHVWRGAGDYRATLSPAAGLAGSGRAQPGADFLRRRRAERLHVNEEFDETQQTLADYA